MRARPTTATTGASVTGSDPAHFEGVGQRQQFSGDLVDHRDVRQGRQGSACCRPDAQQRGEIGRGLLAGADGARLVTGGSDVAVFVGHGRFGGRGAFRGGLVGRCFAPNRPRQQAEGVRHLADLQRGHRLAIDLAGLVAAGERAGRRDHGQRHLHRWLVRRPSAQEQIGEAVGHALVLGAGVAGHRAGLGERLQAPVARPRHRRRHQCGQRRHPVLVAVHPHRPVADRSRQPLRRRRCVGAEHRSAGRLAELCCRLAGRLRQQRSLDLATELVRELAELVDHHACVGPRDRPCLQCGQGGRQLLDQPDRLRQQLAGRPGGQSSTWPSPRRPPTR